MEAAWEVPVVLCHHFVPHHRGPTLSSISLSLSLSLCLSFSLSLSLSCIYVLCSLFSIALSLVSCCAFLHLCTHVSLAGIVHHSHSELPYLHLHHACGNLRCAEWMRRKRWYLAHELAVDTCTSDDKCSYLQARHRKHSSIRQ